MKLAEFKRKLNKIKGANNDILKAGLVAYKLDSTGHKPPLQARLFLATAIEYGHGVLPAKMLQSKAMEHTDSMNLQCFTIPAA